MAGLFNNDKLKRVDSNFIIWSEVSGPKVLVNVLKNPGRYHFENEKKMPKVEQSHLDI